MVVVHEFRRGLSCLVLSAVGSWACAGSLSQTNQSTTEVRGSIAVANLEARMLLAGPARLLHVQADRKARLRLFRVPRQFGTEDDCRGVLDGDEVAVPKRHAEIDVAKDEVVCAKVEQMSLSGKVPNAGGGRKEGRKVLLSWHAKSESIAASETLHHASLP
jgi:hypothetical protein